jgi:hypothetical protein
MKKDKIINIILSITVVAGLFLSLLSFYLSNKRIKILNNKTELSEHMVGFWQRAESVQNEIEISFINGGWFHDSVLWMEYCSNDLVDNVLCLYYSDIHCMTCVDAEIQRLKRFSAMVGQKKVLLFADYNNEKDFLIFKRIHQMNFPVFKIELMNLPSCIKDLMMPCYFVLGEDLRPRNAFIADKQDSVRTLNYLNTIKRIL